MKTARIVVALLAVIVSGASMGQETWPARPTSIVIGYTPGSGMDVIGRFLAEGLRKRTGQPFIVENKPGVFGNIAASYVAKAKPDGYTALFSPGAMAIYPHMFKSTPFDSIADFRSVTTVTKVNYILVVNPAMVPVNSARELIDYVKARPGTTAYASGNATVEIAATLYKNMAGLDSINVRYKGVPESLNELMGGRITWMFADTSFIMPFVRGGKIKALAVAAPMRMAADPTMPTMAEAGLPEFEDFRGWMTMFVPAGTPLALRKAFAEMCNAIMASEEGRQLLARTGLEPFPNTPETADAFFADEFQKWGRLVRAAGIPRE